MVDEDALMIKLEIC